MLELRFLGGFSLASGGRPIDRRVRRRLQSLLALLILNAGTPLSREQIGELLWPEGSADQTLGNLRRLLFDLRHDLPEVAAFVRVSRESVLWPPDGDWTTDILAFQQAAEEPLTTAGVRDAVQRYRGDLLPSCYDDWIVPERDRLRSLFLGVLERGIERAEAAGDYGSAVTYARRLLAEEPLREETYRRLMLVHVAAGDSAAALRTYHLCAGILARELSVEPAPATRDVYELLLRSEMPEGSPIPVGRLVGREREWDRLQAAWRAADHGGAQAVLLIGEPGIGKTRLLDELRAWADRRSISSLYARGYEAEGVLAYAPVVALLRSRPVPSLDPVWLAELARLLPELAVELPGLVPDEAATEPWRRGRLFEALARAILAQQPLLLLVDDIQWIDRDTMEWLHYLLRFAPDRRLLLVCASRPEGAAHAAMSGPLWPELARAGRLEAIELSPLSPDATAELALSLDGANRLTSEQVRRLWAETAGNPLLIVESLRAQTSEEAAESIGAVLSTRLAELSPAARDLAGTAAVIGHAFALPLLMAAGRQDEETIIGALDELWRFRIIREQGTDAYDFVHDRLREAALASISPSTRQILHRRVAAALERVAGPALERVSGEIAAHLMAAGEQPRAAGFHARAGQAAMHVFSYGEAAAHFRRSLELLPEEDNLEAVLGLADTLYNTNSVAEAEMLCRRALSRVSERADERAETHLRYALGVYVRAQGRLAEAIELLERAQAGFARYGAERSRAKALVHLGGALAMMGRGDQALAYLHESDRIARACGDLRLALFAASGLGFIYLEAGDFRRAEEWQLRMLELAERDLNPVATASALQNLGLIAVEQERYETAFDRLVRAIELHAPRGDLINASEDINNLGLAYARVGDLAAARRCHAVAAHMALTSSYRIALYLNLANLARIELEEGHADAAERTARAALLGLEETDIPRLRFDALATLAAALDQCGRLGEAAAAARDLLHVAGETGRDDHAFAAWLLSLRLETLSGLLHRSLVVQELGARLAETADPVRRAALHYTLWQLDPSRGGDAAQVAELYRALYVERSTILYRHRFREMTGEELPLPAGTPKLPAAVTSYPGTVEALLAEVKRTLAQPAAS